jgi:hypothetical protein
MQQNPLKTFILRDFGFNERPDRVYLDTLVRLGLVEEVEVTWKMGKKENMSKGTRGYRLIKKEQDEVLNGRDWIEEEELRNLA